MSFLKSLDISASGMSAQRVRMDTIAQNIANATTSRTADGEPYRRRVVVLSEMQGTAFSTYLSRARSTGPGSPRAARTNMGVKVADIATDNSDLRLEYDPTHPDANEDGYVQYPNVDEVVEMVDMMAATRAFEANVTAFNATKAIASKAFEIGR